jgi:hypothetical protein
LTRDQKVDAHSELGISQVSAALKWRDIPAPVESAMDLVESG